MTVPSATLTDIRTKVRRITKSPSVNQITDAQIDFYVNTFYAYDFPEHLRLKDLFSNYTFTTQPNQDRYAFDTDNYLTVEPPLYINGYQSFFTQSQENFYRIYPKLGLTSSTATGTGAAGPYTFTLSNFPVLQRNIVISADDGAGHNLVATDSPLDQTVFPNQGDLVGDTVVGSAINYVTGVVTITFTAGIAAGTAINCQIVPYQPNQPVGVLFYQNFFHLRPVPDSSYSVSIASYQTPTQLLLTTDNPQLKQWWQLLALGASLKIFEDKGDFDQIAAYRVIFDEQMRLALRRTIVEQTNERTATIYTDQTGSAFMSNFFNQF